MRNFSFVVMLLIVLLGLFVPAGTEAMPMFGARFDSGQRNPAIAALLSLVPVPIALGQFYAGDWAMGLVFSAVETAEMGTTAGVAVYEGSTMMAGGVAIRDWDRTGQVVFFSALGSFVLTKFVDAFTAALSADAYGRNHPVAEVSLAVREREVGLILGFRY